MSELGFNIVLRVYDFTEKLERVPITAYKREGDDVYKEVKPASMRRYLKCDCGHHDYTTDSCAINDYACNGCGSVTSVCNGPERQELGDQHDTSI